MREILFRGKTLIDNEWVIGAGVYKSEGYTWIITDDVTRTESRGTGSDAIIPETVGQYTGLTDKNVKSIFEGDIVKNDYGYIGLIVFKACSYYIEWCSGNFTNDLYVMADSLEIIGNIHDNPELLKGEETK